MNYRELKTYSCGSKNGRWAKINAIGYGIAFILFCSLHIMFFTINLHEDKTQPMIFSEHLLAGITFSMILGWLTFLLFEMLKDTFYALKENKEITLYLYSFPEFIKLQKIPSDKFILFSDMDGIVLADKKHKKESKYFTFGVKSFYEFLDYYDKHKENCTQKTINVV